MILMSRYMVLFKGNASVWPTDPKQALAVTEKVQAGADYLLKSGVLQEIGMFTATDGYGIVQADSKEKVLEVIAPFYPLFSQEIHEIVPWDKAKDGIIKGLRAAASM